MADDEPDAPGSGHLTSSQDDGGVFVQVSGLTGVEAHGQGSRITRRQGQNGSRMPRASKAHGGPGWGAR